MEKYGKPGDVYGEMRTVVVNPFTGESMRYNGDSSIPKVPYDLPKHYTGPVGSYSSDEYRRSVVY